MTEATEEGLSHLECSILWQYTTICKHQRNTKL